MRALALQSAVFWLVLAAIGLGLVPVLVWLALHGVAGLALLVIALGWAGAGRVRARTWLAVAFYSVFLACFFAGANVALDVLHGAHRRRTDAAADLGELEMWFVLCPGLFSVALGAWLLARRAEAAPAVVRSAACAATDRPAHRP